MAECCFHHYPSPVQDCIEKGLERNDWRLVEESVLALATLSKQADTHAAVLQLRPLGVLTDAMNHIDATATAAGTAESRYVMTEAARRGAREAVHDLVETLTKRV